MKRVLIGFLGTTLDAGKTHNRWERWRPSVGACYHEDFLVDRFDMFCNGRSRQLAERVGQDIKDISPETEMVYHHMPIKDPWDFEEVYTALHDFCHNYPFDTDNEEYYIQISTGTHVAQICLFILTESHHFPAKLLQTSPAKDRHDPRGEYRVIDLDLSRYDAIATRFAQQQLDDISMLKSGIDTKNQNFNRLIEKIEKVAVRSSEPILITGATGAGKSQLASKIYELKKSRSLIKGEFVEINCATIRGDSAMSALFGHAKGSFTGATSDRKGALQRANKGLLFLDEVGELGLDEQAMLLRAIEEKRFLPLGSDSEVESNFSLICGTNKDLFNKVDEGVFREDLLARINLWTFKLPSLKERREDIPPNIEYELQKFEQKYNEKARFNKEAYERFLSFAISEKAEWKGNFRDLGGAVTRMATLSESGRITEEVVKEEVETLSYFWGTHSSTLPHKYPNITSLLGKEKLGEIDIFDLVQLEEVLGVCKESVSLSEAGRKLFAVSRVAKKSPNDADRLKKYLAKFGVEWKDIRATS